MTRAGREVVRYKVCFFVEMAWAMTPCSSAHLARSLLRASQWTTTTKPSDTAPNHPSPLHGLLPRDPRPRASGELRACVARLQQFGLVPEADEGVVVVLEEDQGGEGGEEEQDHPRPLQGPGAETDELGGASDQRQAATSSTLATTGPIALLDLLTRVRTEGLFAAADAGLIEYLGRNERSDRDRIEPGLFWPERDELAVLALKAEAVDRATRCAALDDLILRANQGEGSARRLVEIGLLETVMHVVRDSGDPAAFDGHDYPDDAHPDWFLAFDVLTNLCKWPRVRSDLIEAGAAEFLHPLSLRNPGTSYFAFEATEGLAYLIGSGHGFAPELRVPPVENVEFLIRVLEDCLRGEANLFGMSFGLYGRVLAMRRLAENPANRRPLTKAIASLMEVVVGYRGGNEVIREAVTTLCLLSRGERDQSGSNTAFRDVAREALANRPPGLGQLVRYAGTRIVLDRSATDDDGRGEFADAVGAELLVACALPGELSWTTSDDGLTSLHHAAMAGNARACATLLQAEVDPLAIDHRGRTALHYACRGGGRRGGHDDSDHLAAPQRCVELLGPLAWGLPGEDRIRPASEMFLTHLLCDVTEFAAVARVLVRMGAVAPLRWRFARDHPDRAEEFDRACRDGERDRFVLGFITAGLGRIGVHSPAARIPTDVVRRVAAFACHPLPPTRDASTMSPPYGRAVIPLEQAEVPGLAEMARALLAQLQLGDGGIEFEDDVVEVGGDDAVGGSDDDGEAVDDLPPRF